MEKLFYASVTLNGLTVLYLILTGIKLAIRGQSPVGNVMTLLFSGVLLIALIIVSINLWNTSHYHKTAVWISWAPWLVIIVCSMVFIMLTAGEKWN